MFEWDMGTGKQVKAGQSLVVMSAMKMETSVAAPCDGIVRHVAVDVKDSVEAGEKLMSPCHEPCHRLALFSLPHLSPDLRGLAQCHSSRQCQDFLKDISEASFTRNNNQENLQNPSLHETCLPENPPSPPTAPHARTHTHTLPFEAPLSPPSLM